MDRWNSLRPWNFKTMPDLLIPAERDFPPGYLERRKQDLVRAAAGSAGAGRRRFGWWHAHAGASSTARITSSRVRLSLAAIAVVIAAVVSAVAFIGGADNGRNHSAAAVRVSVATLSSGGKSVKAAALIDVRLTPTVRRVSEPVIVGGNEKQRALLREILDAIPGNSLTRIELVTSGDGSGDVTLEFNASGSDPLRSDWEEMLVAGVFRELSAKEGLPAVLGLPPIAPRSGLAAPIDADRLAAKVRSAAAGAAATLEELHVYKPDGIAVAVVLRVDDPAAFLQQRLPRFLDALGDRWRDYDGTFVEVVDDSAAFVWAAGTDPLVSHGSVATRADLTGCSPVVNLGAMPPPCPAR
jgi:hypothetical protein